MKKYLQFIFAILSHLLMTTLTFAQDSSGSISGWVHDEKSSLPIPFAKIELLAEGKLIKTVLADSIGKYQVPIEQTQLITLRVSADLHESQQRDLILSIGFDAQAYFSLKGQQDVSSEEPQRFICCRGPAACVTTVAGVQDYDGAIGSIRGSRSPSSTMLDCSETRADGSLQGKISDSESGESIPFANIVVMKNGKQVQGCSSDLDGIYKLKGLAPGLYDLMVSVVGYTKEEKSQILVKASKVLFVDFRLQPGVLLQEAVVVEYCMPLIEKDGATRCFFSHCCFGSCSCSSSIIKKEQEIESTSELPIEAHSISLFPNPATTQITLDLSAFMQEPLTIRILDSSGRIVLEQKSVQLSKLIIPLDRLSDGVYFASVQLKDELLTERFIMAR